MTDFQPGDSVQHPEKGRGYVLSYGSNWPEGIRITYTDPKASCGYSIDIINLDGWERAQRDSRSDTARIHPIDRSATHDAPTRKRVK